MNVRKSFIVLFFALALASMSASAQFGGVSVSEYPPVQVKIFYISGKDKGVEEKEINDWLKNSKIHVSSVTTTRANDLLLAITVLYHVRK